MKVTVSTRNIPPFRDPAVLLIDQLKEIYIDAELEPIDTAQWFPKVMRGDYTIGLNLTGNGLDDPDQTLYENFTCGAEGNYDRYCNPELDKMVDRQSMEFDTAKRKELVWAIERKLAEDAARPILWHNRSGTCWHPYVKGYVADDQQHLQRPAHGRRLARSLAAPGSERCGRTRVSRLGTENGGTRMRATTWLQRRVAVAFRPQRTCSFGAGALVMLTASRIAPPFAGQAIGSIRALAGGDPFDALAQDHRKVLALFERIEATENSAVARRAAMLFQAKRMLTAHALAEEDVIYPMMHDYAQRPEQAKQLYHEHAEVKIRLFELEHKAKDDPSWIEDLRSLHQLVQRACQGRGRDRVSRSCGRLRTKAAPATSWAKCIGKSDATLGPAIAGDCRAEKRSAFRPFCSSCRRNGSALFRPAFRNTGPNGATI